MLRSLYSGVSGMRGFQQKLDVIGNNISNVNTFGYKKGRLTFKDMISQTTRSAAEPDGVKGGTNPLQVGLGVSIGSIDTIHTQGSLQTTNRPLDLGITGDGFFGVSNGDSTYYTRAGNFYLDRDGAIVNADGLYLQAVGGGQIEIPPEAKSFSIGQNGIVTYIDGATNQPVEAGQIGLAKFSNPGALEKAGSNLYLYTLNSNDGEPLLIEPASDIDGTGALVSGALEMSNVDLSEEFTEMIVTQRGFQANTKIITTSDEILQELVNLKR
jgi:flagellar hook protein FlgE